MTSNQMNMATRPNLSPHTLRVLADVWESAAKDLAAQRDQAQHEFKNFHRLLCERFHYSHDEVDWKRDQLSLIEHIAKGFSPETELNDAPPALQDGTQVGVTVPTVHRTLNEGAIPSGAANEKPWPVPSGWRGKEPWLKVGDLVRPRTPFCGQRPLCTVTEIIANGFKYEHAPIPTGSPHWGEYRGGETYEPSEYEFNQGVDDGHN